MSARAQYGNAQPVTSWVDSYGLVALFLILALQAAGVPGPPGKTALVVASLLAANGRMVLWQGLPPAAPRGGGRRPRRLRDRSRRRTDAARALVAGRQARAAALRGRGLLRAAWAEVGVPRA